MSDSRHGFRYDPMEWARNTESLTASFVRKMVLSQPSDGDERVLEDHIQASVRDCAEKGALGAQKVLQLLALGCPRNTREIQQVATEIAGKALAQGGEISCYDLEVLCKLADGDGRIAEARDLALPGVVRKAESRDLFAGCPATPMVHLRALCAAKGLPGVDHALTVGMERVLEIMNEVGYISSKNPFAFLDLAASLGSEAGRRIALQQLPIILRAQESNGSWGGMPTSPGGLDQTAVVFRSLVRYGFLEQLRKLPPLPPDWRIVKSFPMPKPENVFTSLTWDGNSLWTYDEKHALVAISPRDSKMAKRLPLPEELAPADHLIGCWDGFPAMTVGKEIRQFDRDTGELRRTIAIGTAMGWSTGLAQVGQRLWVADSFEWYAAVYDIPTKTWGHVILSQPTGHAGSCFAAAGDGLWHFDWSLPLIVKSSTDVKPVSHQDPDLHDHGTKLLDYGEKPFGSDTWGVAHDGKNLWVLDNKDKLVCLIEKTEAGKGITAALAADRERRKRHAEPSVPGDA